MELDVLILLMLELTLWFFVASTNIEDAEVLILLMLELTLWYKGLMSNHKVSVKS